MKKFDVVIMNPPYQKPTKGGNGARDFWPDFVKKSFELTSKEGFVCNVHPSKWRKPFYELYPKIANGIKYLEIHNEADGMKTFKCSTRYDWYIWKNNNDINKFDVVMENGWKIAISNNLPFIPNYNIEELFNCVAKENEEKCEVLYSRSLYGNDKKNMSKEKTDEFKYPCVYGMYKDRTFSCQYSSVKKDFFDIPKVILGIGRHLYPLVDFEGKYAMTQNAFAIKVSDVKEANFIKNAIESSRFKEIMKSTKWRNFQTDYHMFETFRKDFWKEFVDENGNEI